MANFKTDMYKRQNAELTTKSPMGEFNGKSRILYFDFTAAQDVYAVNDTISLCKLPKGAKVVDWKLLCPSLGTTGIFSLGNAASVETSGGSAVEAADVDAFGAAYDAGGAAVLAQPDASNDGLM